MKSLILAAALLALPLSAFAQMPLPGTAAVGPAKSNTMTPAPVPTILPDIPSNGAPSPVPDQIAASPGSNAGPANATPFSAAPAGLLPNNGEGTSTQDAIQPGGAASRSPNLSR